MTIFLFFISFFILVGFFTVKFFEISKEEKHIVSEVICLGDEYCYEAVVKTKSAFRKIKFKNFKKIAFIIATFVKKEIIYLKRRFDSKQPKFLIKQIDKHDIHQTGSVSTFLKSVSDYKNSLKKKRL